MVYSYQLYLSFTHRQADSASACLSDGFPDRFGGTRNPPKKTEPKRLFENPPKLAENWPLRGLVRWFILKE